MSAQNYASCFNTMNGVFQLLGISWKTSYSCMGTARAMFKFASFIKSCPFVVRDDDVEGFRLEPFQSKWRSCLWYVPSLIMYAYTVFQVVSFARIISAEGLNAESSLHIAFLATFNGLESLLRASNGWFLKFWNYGRHESTNINCQSFPFAPLKMDVSKAMAYHAIC